MTIQEEISELENELAVSVDLKQQGEIIMKLLNKHATINSKHGEKYMARFNQIAAELNTDEYRAWAYYYTGDISKMSGNYTLALEATEKALKLFTLLNHARGIATSHNNIANIYQGQGHYPKALQHYFPLCCCVRLRRLSRR